MLTSSANAPAKPPVRTLSLRRTVGALAVTLLVFSPWLYELIAYAVHSPLYSHIPLIPLISGVLIWRGRHRLATPDNGAAAAIVMALVAAGLLLARLALERRPVPPPVEDAMAVSTSAFVVAAWAAALWSFGFAGVRTCLFPLGFLLLMIPLPTALLDSLQLLLQHGSAAVARLLFSVTGTPYLYYSLGFELPGIRIEVAPACSGIHSTLALFIVSLLAGRWFLRSPARAALLALVVLPLALLRNGARIYVIGELCVHRGPQMINSPIHRHGGPLFFAASLVPLLAVLWLLMRSERRHSVLPTNV